MIDEELLRRTCPHCRRVFAKQYGRDRHVDNSCPIRKAEEVKEKTKPEAEKPATILKSAGVITETVSRLNHCRYIRYTKQYLFILTFNC